MEVAVRTYRMINRGLIRAISIETIDEGTAVRLTIEYNNDSENTMSIDLPREVALCIRDHLNTYLDESNNSND